VSDPKYDLDLWLVELSSGTVRFSEVVRADGAAGAGLSVAHTLVSTDDLPDDGDSYLATVYKLTEGPKDRGGGFPKFLSARMNVVRRNGVGTIENVVPVVNGVAPAAAAEKAPDLYQYRDRLDRIENWLRLSAYFRFPVLRNRCLKDRAVYKKAPTAADLPFEDNISIDLGAPDVFLFGCRRYLVLSLLYYEGEPDNVDVMLRDTLDEVTEDVTDETDTPPRTGYTREVLVFDADKNAQVPWTATRKIELNLSYLT
jgi:hypothetical protein